MLKQLPVFVSHLQHRPISGHSPGSKWLRSLLFNPDFWLSLQTAFVFLDGLSRASHCLQEIVTVLTSYLFQLGAAGSDVYDFFTMYMALVSGRQGSLVPQCHYLLIVGCFRNWQT